VRPEEMVWSAPGKSVGAVIGRQTPHPSKSSLDIHPRLASKRRTRTWGTRRVPNRETIAAMEAGERGEVRRATSVAAMMAELNAHR
jgi:hypothetical protein